MNIVFVTPYGFLAGVEGDGAEQYNAGMHLRYDLNPKSIRSPKMTFLLAS